MYSSFKQHICVCSDAISYTINNVCCLVRSSVSQVFLQIHDMGNPRLPFMIGYSHKPICSGNVRCYIPVQAVPPYRGANPNIVASHLSCLQSSSTPMPSIPNRKERVHAPSCQVTVEEAACHTQPCRTNKERTRGSHDMGSDRRIPASMSSIQAGC